MTRRLTLLILLILLTASLANAGPVTPDFKAQLAKTTADSQKLAVYKDIYEFYKGFSGDSAQPYIEQGLEDFTRSGYDYGRGALLLLLSNIYNERGMLVLAREKGRQALAIFTELKDPQHIGKAEVSVGNAESYLGNYPDAVAHFLAALKCLEQVRDTTGIINTYLELGAANDFNGEHGKARGYYNKALDLSLRTKETASIVYLYNNIGLSYARNGEFKEALKYFEKAELISRNPEYVKTRMHPLTNLGKVYDALGDHKKALEYLYQAKTLAQSLHTQDPLCRVLLEIGRIESAATPPDTRSLEEGLQVAKNMDSKRLQAEFLSALAAVAERTGNYKEEVALLKQARVLRDSIFNIDKAKEIANLQSEYDLKRTSTQLAALERSEQRNAYKKNIIICIAVILALTLVTLLVFYTRSRRLNKELYIREQDLKKANEVKDRLFSIIGHDLKGPIGNIPSLLSIYRKEGNTEVEKSYILKAMEESSQASLETLEKLLNWGTQQIKGTTFHPTELDVDEIMKDKIRLLGAAAANKDITIVNNIPPATRVFADENQFKFIMRNLVSNAIKFTHAGGTVTVSAELQPGDSYVFSVTDTGIGMAPEKQQHIFEPYNQSTVGTANETGTSIGLMLCREFVRQNGGDIWVTSEEGQGTTFSFTVKGNWSSN